MTMPDNTTPIDPLTVTFTRDGTQEPHPLVPVPAEYLRAGHRTLPPAEYLEALAEARNGWFRVWGVAGAESPIPHAPCPRCGQLVPVVPGFDLPGTATAARGAGSGGVAFRYPQHNSADPQLGQRVLCKTDGQAWDNHDGMHDLRTIVDAFQAWRGYYPMSITPGVHFPWWEAIAARDTPQPDSRIGATLDTKRARPSDPLPEWVCPGNLTAWGMVPVSDPPWYATIPTEGVDPGAIAGGTTVDGTLLWRHAVTTIACVMHEDVLPPPEGADTRTPPPFTARRKGRPFPGIRGGVEALPAHVVTHSLATTPGAEAGNVIGGVSLYLHPLAFEVVAVAIWDALRSYAPGQGHPDTPLAVLTAGSNTTIALTPRGEKRAALFLRRYLRVLGMFPIGPVCHADDATADRYIAEAWAIMQLAPNRAEYDAAGPVPALRAYLGPLVAAANRNAVIRE